MTWAKVTALVLFVDSEAYHEQMGPLPSSNGSLDIALSNAPERNGLYLGLGKTGKALLIT